MRSALSELASSKANKQAGKLLTDPLADREVANQLLEQLHSLPNAVADAGKWQDAENVRAPGLGDLRQLRMPGRVERDCLHRWVS